MSEKRVVQRRLFSVIVLAIAIWARQALQSGHAKILTLEWMEIYNTPFQPARFFSDVFAGLCLYLPGCVGTAWLLLLAVQLWQGRGTTRILGYLSKPWFCPLLAFLLAVFLRTTVMHNFEAVTDEVGFAFQSEIFCSGHLTALAPPSPDHFAHTAYKVFQDRWSFIGAPGWPILLALGRLLLIPNLVSPLVLAGTVFLMQTLSRRWHGAEASAWTGALALGSPTIMLNGSGGFSHLATAFWVLATLNCLERVRPGNLSWSFAGGLCLGLTTSTRSVDGAILCAVIFVWRVILPPPSYQRPSLAQVLTLVVSLGCGLLPLLAQNQAFTGNPFLTGYEVFGVVSGVQSVGLLTRIHLAFLHLTRMLFWGSPFLLELIVYACLRPERRIWYLLLLLTCNALIYGHPEMAGIGIRYLLPALVVLTTGAGNSCLSLFSQRRDKWGAFLPFYFLFLTGAVYPGYLKACFDVYSSTYAREVWLTQVIGPKGIGILRFDPGSVGMSFPKNRPDLQGPIRVVSLGPEQDALLAKAFPDRAVIYLDSSPDQTRLFPTVFDRSQDDFTRLCGGAHYANEVENPEKALELWGQIPQQSPWKQAALSNSIRILKRLGRHEQAHAAESQLKSYSQPEM